MYELLDKIDSPADLKKLSVDELPQLCDELRRFIIAQLSHAPGHFAASLGVVELTVALHYVYDLPTDKLVWDVGHQAYGHKILTGRRESFKTNRKRGGISGFPNIAESEYDAFGVGHSSTSISAALGMATAFKLSGEKGRHVVAVIGDGAMTGGEAFEGLNNMAENEADMLVILNDNNMAIDEVTGGLNQYLLDITTSGTYNRLRTRIAKRDKGGILHRMARSLKNLITHRSNVFEGLGIRYFGPADGHDVKYLVGVLSDLKKIGGAKMLHVITKKGKGFKAAEENPTVWHSVDSDFDPETGVSTKEKSEEPMPPKFQTVFGETLLELAEKNEKILGITPAMPTGCSLNIMMKAMPERCFDVGIAEQHAVTFAAGLAVSGYVPFCNIYSTFAQRAFDQVIHDVALQKLHVVMCFDRGGLVGADGPTHHGVFDIAMLRCIPNLTIMSPMDEPELRNMMYTAQKENVGAVVIRYPRGRGSVIDWRKPMSEIEIGKSRVIREGKDVAVISLGPIGVRASRAAERTGAMHIDLRFAKPIDTVMLDRVMGQVGAIVTVEDGAVCGGVGTAIAEYAEKRGYKGKITTIGVPDRFIAHGTVEELYAECGMDEESIVRAIEEAKSKA
jgi:1-deoxy-D-xylulose-5-phosphate synthase